MNKSRNMVKDELLAYPLLLVKEKIENIYDIAWKAGVKWTKTEIIDIINEILDIQSPKDVEYSEGYKDALNDIKKRIEKL